MSVGPVAGNGAGVDVAQAKQAAESQSKEAEVATLKSGENQPEPKIPGMGENVNIKV